MDQIPRKGPDVPPAVRRKIRVDYVTGRFPRIADAARAAGVNANTAHEWSSKEGWVKLRADFERRAMAAEAPAALARLSGLPGQAGLESALAHVGALIISETDAKALDKLTVCLQRLEFTRFALLNGFVPSQGKPAGPTARPAKAKPGAGGPAHLDPADKEPIGTLPDVEDPRKSLPGNGAVN